MRLQLIRFFLFSFPLLAAAVDDPHVFVELTHGFAVDLQLLLVRVHESDGAGEAADDAIEPIIHGGSSCRSNCTICKLLESAA